VAISPDDTWLASARDSRTVRIWDASTGHAPARIPRLRDLTRVKDVIEALLIPRPGRMVSRCYGVKPDARAQAIGAESKYSDDPAHTAHCAAIDLAMSEHTDGPIFLAADGRWLDPHGVARIEASRSGDLHV
jgi:hypothetical protein